METQNLNEALDWLQATAGQIQNFAEAQTPLYCQEVVAWTFWYGLTFTIFGFLLFVVPFALAYRYRKDLKEIINGDGFAIGVLVMVAMLLLVPGFAVVMTNAPHVIKAVVAPRLVIVEHLKGLVK